MSYASGESDRMIAAMLMDCVVAAVDTTASPPVVRVRAGEWTSAWVRWHSVAAGKARRIFCSIKFQGGTDHEIAASFAAIPHARVFHSAHNKHELTFAWLPPAHS